MTAPAYGKTETREEGQLCVLFYKQTYTVRLYAIEQLVYDWGCTKIESCYAKELFRSPEELLKRFSLFQLNSHIRELTTKRSRPLYDARDRACDRPDYDEESNRSAAEALWLVFQKVGDKITREPGYSATPDEDRWRFDLDKIASVEGQGKIAAMPKQARQLLKEAITMQWKAVSEDDLRKMLTAMVREGRLKTKQCPYKILSYYSGPMFEAGFLQYPGRRDRPDAEEDAPPQAEAA